MTFERCLLCALKASFRQRVSKTDYSFTSALWLRWVADP